MTGEAREVRVAMPQLAPVVDGSGGDDNVRGRNGEPNLSHPGAQMPGFQPNILGQLQPVESEEVLLKLGERRGAWGALQHFDDDEPDRRHRTIRKRLLEATLECLRTTGMVVVDPHGTVDEHERITHHRLLSVAKPAQHGPGDGEREGAGMPDGLRAPAFLDQGMERSLDRLPLGVGAADFGGQVEQRRIHRHRESYHIRLI